MKEIRQNEKTMKKTGTGSQAARERMLEKYNLSKRELTPQKAREKMLQKRGGGKT